MGNISHEMKQFIQQFIQDLTSACLFHKWSLKNKCHIFQTNHFYNLRNIFVCRPYVVMLFLGNKVHMLKNALLNDLLKNVNGLPETLNQHNSKL